MSSSAINQAYDRISDAGVSCATLRRLHLQLQREHPAAMDLCVQCSLEVTRIVTLLADLGVRIGAAGITGDMPKPEIQSVWESTELARAAPAPSPAPAPVVLASDGTPVESASRFRSLGLQEVSRELMARTLRRAGDDSLDAGSEGGAE